MSRSRLRRGPRGLRYLQCRCGRTIYTEHANAPLWSEGKAGYGYLECHCGQWHGIRRVKRHGWRRPLLEHQEFTNYEVLNLARARDTARRLSRALDEFEQHEALSSHPWGGRYTGQAHYLTSPHDQGVAPVGVAPVIHNPGPELSTIGPTTPHP